MRDEYFGHGFGCCGPWMHHGPRFRHYRHRRPWRHRCLTKEEFKGLLVEYKEVLERKLAKINERLEELDKESGEEEPTEEEA